MIEIRVEKQADGDSEKLWQTLCNFGDLSWFPATEKVESTGSGPGMVRRVFMPDDGGYIDEKLESIDESTKTLSYSIAKAAAFPFSNYQANIVVSETSPTRATIVWTATADGVEGIPESEAKAMIEGVYTQMLDGLFNSVA